MVVKSTSGNKATLSQADGTEVHNVHFEDMILVGDTVRDMERPPELTDQEPLFFPEYEEYGILDDISLRRSSCEMQEDDGKLRAYLGGSGDG